MAPRPRGRRRRRVVGRTPGRGQAAAPLLLKTSLAAIRALALGLSLAPAALAHGPSSHGGAPDGHGGPDGLLGVLLLPPRSSCSGESPSWASSTPSSGAGDERVRRGRKGLRGHGRAAGFGTPLRGRIRFGSLGSRLAGFRTARAPSNGTDRGRSRSPVIRTTGTCGAGRGAVRTRRRAGSPVPLE
jgi:hypothetical protein